MTKEEWEIVSKGFVELEACIRLNRKIDMAGAFIAGCFVGAIIAQIVMVVG